MAILDTIINTAAKQFNQKNKTTINKKALPQSESELVTRRENAEKMIHNKSLMSSAAAVVPIPGLDVTADLKLMTDIIEQINKEYGLSHKQVNGYSDDLKQKVMFNAAKQGSDFIGKKISKSLVAVIMKMIAKRELMKQSKWVPLVGQAVSGTISYYMMRKMGMMHIEKCEKVARALMTE